MAGAAGSLAIQDPRFTLTAIGGGLFLLSDLILGNRELRDNGWLLVHDVVWVLYIAGQALIVISEFAMTHCAGTFSPTATSEFGCSLFG